MLVLIALVVTFGTLLLQGSTLPWLVRRLGLPGPDPLEDRLQEAAVLRAGHRRGAALPGRSTSIPTTRTASARTCGARWSGAPSWPGSGWGGRRHESPNRKQQRLRLGMLRGRARRGAAAARRGEVPHEVLQSVMAALDVEESVLVRAAEGMDALPDRDDELQAPVGSAGLCEHLRAAPAAVRPAGAGVCSRCIEMGWQWVHLRMCLDCGNVGCCDSSQRQARRPSTSTTTATR